MSCCVQPGGRAPPDGAAEAEGEGAGAIDMLAAALAVAAGAVEPALGATLLPGARAGPNVHAWPAVGAQAARPAAATRPPPVIAALRRNLRRDSAVSSRSEGGRL